MTPSEKYFAFLDRAFTTNSMFGAELDRGLDPEFVERKWRQFSEVRVLARTVVTADLTIADAGTGSVDFQAREVSPAEWDLELAKESLIDYGVERHLRCRMWTSPEHDQSRVVLVGHHAVVDGKSGIAELQAFVRSLDGQSIVEQRELSTPGQDGADRFVWQSNAREMIALLREISRAHRTAGEPGPSSWPAAEVARRPRFAPMHFDANETRSLLRNARVHGARAYSSLAAAWLNAVAVHVCQQPDATVELNTPVDVSVVERESATASGVAVGVLAHRFTAQPGAPWALARDVAQAISLAVERGEGDLFFRLARTDRVADLDAGARLVADSLAAAQPAVSVANFGIVDPGSDPSWLRSVCGYQAPTPNQIAFVSGLGYRGQLVNSVSTDDNRVPPAASAALLQGHRDLVTAMSEPLDAGSPGAS